MKNIRQKGIPSKKERRRNKSSSPERTKNSQIRKRINSRKKTSDAVEQVSGSSSSSDVSIDNDYDSSQWPSDDDSEDKHNMIRLRALERKRQRLEDEEEDFWFIFILLVIFVLGIALLYLFFTGYTSKSQSNGGTGWRDRHQAQQQRRRSGQLEDSVYQVSSTLKQLYVGDPKKKVSIERQVVCPSCGNCPDCRSHHMEKQTQRDFFSGRIYHTCYCNYVVPLTFQIQPGMRHNDVVRMEGLGNRHPNAYDGDVVFQVTSSNSYGNFQRFDGIHLRTKITISLKEALLGFTRKISHLDSHIVTIKQKGKVTQHNDVMVIENEGMPVKDEERGVLFGGPTHGDLYVTVLVQFPKKIDKKILKIFEKLF